MSLVTSLFMYSPLIVCPPPSNVPLKREEILSLPIGVHSLPVRSMSAVRVMVLPEKSVPPFTSCASPASSSAVEMVNSRPSSPPPSSYQPVSALLSQPSAASGSSAPAVTGSIVRHRARTSRMLPNFCSRLIWFLLFVAGRRDCPAGTQRGQGVPPCRTSLSSILFYQSAL